MRTKGHSLAAVAAAIGILAVAGGSALAQSTTTTDRPATISQGAAPAGVTAPASGPAAAPAGTRAATDLGGGSVMPSHGRAEVVVAPTRSAPAAYRAYEPRAAAPPVVARRNEAPARSRDFGRFWPPVF
ncbi:MAG: hypothetical protein AB7O57_04780 [Hyphomicrobiaceae bacterium]